MINKLTEQNEEFKKSNKKLYKLYNGNKNLQDKLNIIESKLDKATDTRIILHKKKNENKNKYYCL
jgi:cell shape-determining protein MreC